MQPIGVEQVKGIGAAVSYTHLILFVCTPYLDDKINAAIR